MFITLVQDIKQIYVKTKVQDLWVMEFPLH